MNLLHNINIVYLSSDIAGGTSERNSHHVDMQGYEGCLYLGIASSDTHSANGITMSVQGCSSTTLASFSTYSPGSTTVNTPELDATWGFKNKIIAVDLVKPLKRYSRCCVYGASDGIMHILGIQYNSRKPGSTECLNHVVAGAANSGTACVGGSTILVSPTS